MRNILTYFEFFVKLKIRIANKGCKNIISVTVAKNGFYYVKFEDGLFNYANNKTFKLINNEYYEAMSDFYDGICRARLHSAYNHYNFIKEDGTLLVNKTYSYARRFVNGFAVVKQNNGYNYIDTNGKLLSNDVFAELHNFSCNRGLVRFRDGYLYLKGWTFIKPNGELIGKFFTRAQDFIEDRAIVYRFDDCHRTYGYTPIDLDGNFITEEKFNYLSDYHNGVAVAKKTVFCNKILIDKNGNVVKEFDY